MMLTWAGCQAFILGRQKSAPLECGAQGSVPVSLPQLHQLACQAPRAPRTLHSTASPLQLVAVIRYVWVASVGFVKGLSCQRVVPGCELAVSLI